MDLPRHHGVLQPEAVYFDGEALTFVLAKADANLTETAEFIQNARNRGPLLVYLCLQLLQDLQHVHDNDKVLGGDLSPDSILVFRMHGVPEVKLVPGKHTVPAASFRQQEAMAEFIRRPPDARARELVPDLDVVPCGFIAPELVVANQKGAAVVSQASDMWATGSIMWFMLTGWPFGCRCEDDNFVAKLIELENLPLEVNERTFWQRFALQFEPDLSPRKAQGFGDVRVSSAWVLPGIGRKKGMDPSLTPRRGSGFRGVERLSRTAEAEEEEKEEEGSRAGGAPGSKPGARWRDPFVGLGEFAAPLVKLIRQLVVVKPSERLSAAQALRDPVFDMKPHPQSSFANFHQMYKFISDFKKMSPEAREQIMQVAAEQYSEEQRRFGAGPTHAKKFEMLLPPTAQIRQRLVLGLIKQLSTRVPECSNTMTQILAQAVRLTDRLLPLDTKRGDYAKALLANLAFSMNVGTGFPLPVQRKLMALARDFCAAQFNITLDENLQDLLQARTLMAHNAEMFVEQKLAQEQEMTVEALEAMVNQDAPSHQWVREQDAVRGRRAHVSAGPYISQQGTVIRTVGAGSQRKVLLKLDSGEQVMVSAEKLFFE